MVVKFIPVAERVLEEQVEDLFLKSPGLVQTISTLRSIPPLTDNPDFTLTELVTESDITAYERAAPIFSTGSLSLSASPFSYRRFDLRGNGQRYSLKMCSPLNPPRFFVSLGPIAESLEIPRIILEVPERRSLLIHKYLQEKGVPCATEPVGCFTFLLESDMTLYDGQLPVDAYLPIDISVERATKNTRRVEFITPEALAIAAAAKKMNSFDYTKYLLNSMGKIHHQLHHLDEEGCFLTAVAANKAIEQHFFNISVPWLVSEGENPLHNTEIDLDSGDLYVTADFSDAVLLTSGVEGEIALDNEFLMATQKRKVSQNAIGRARRTAIAYFLDIAQDHRPLLYALQHSGVISRDEYQQHIGLLDTRLDALVQKQATTLYQFYLEDLQRHRLIRKLSLPWCTFAHQQVADGVTISMLSGLHEEAIELYVLGIAHQYGVPAKNVLETIKKRITEAISETKAILEMDNNYPAILREHAPAYDQAVAKEEGAAQALVRSPVTQRIFDLFMEGYHS